MSKNSNFMIRRSDRHEIMLPVRLRVHEADEKSVRLSSRSGHRNGWVNADIVNLARGGIGVISQVYFPRGCSLIIEVLQLGDEQSAAILSITAKIRRLVMTDRRPAYLLGMVFVDVTSEQEKHLEELISKISGVAGVVDREGGDV